MLLAEGCTISAYDPAAIKRAEDVFPVGPNLSFAADPYAAARDADALLILTDWKEFATLDLDRLKEDPSLPHHYRWPKPL